MMIIQKNELSAECSTIDCYEPIDNRAPKRGLCRICLRRQLKSTRLLHNISISVGMWERCCPNPNGNPNCARSLKYNKVKCFDVGIEKNTMCKSCANLETPRTIVWSENISKSKRGLKLTSLGLKKLYETKLKMRLQSLTIEDLRCNYKIYKREVWYWTNKNDIKSFINYDRRGRAGAHGAFQLDHIVSIYYGFLNNIDPEKIGSMQNLKFIPWEVNLKKRGNLPSFDMHSYYQLQHDHISSWVNNLLKCWGHEVMLPKLKRIDVE